MRGASPPRHPLDSSSASLIEEGPLQLNLSHPLNLNTRSTREDINFNIQYQSQSSSSSESHLVPTANQFALTI